MIFMRMIIHDWDQAGIVRNPLSKETMQGGSQLENLTCGDTDTDADDYLNRNDNLLVLMEGRVLLIGAIPLALFGRCCC